MTDNYSSLAHALQSALGLDSGPVAISFSAEPPAGATRVAAPALAGCAYWRMAAEGDVFTTAAEDHFGCPIGAFTHNVPLPKAKQEELQSTVELMAQLKYLRVEEVPNIPHRTEEFRYATYSPLAKCPAAPDVVMLHGTPKQMMMVAEAAQAAGDGAPLAAMGRPACCAIPHAMNTGGAAASFGCIGNRVYTGLDDNHFYFSIPGAQLSAIAGKLSEIAHANEELRKHHTARCAC